MCSWQVTRKHQEESQIKIQDDSNHPTLSILAFMVLVLIVFCRAGSSDSDQRQRSCQAKSAPQILDSFTIYIYARAGKLTCILGPSGSGKTTLLNAGDTQVQGDLGCLGISSNLDLRS